MNLPSRLFLFSSTIYDTNKYFLSKAKTSGERKSVLCLVGSRKKHGAWDLADLTRIPVQVLVSCVGNFSESHIGKYKMRLMIKKNVQACKDNYVSMVGDHSG